MPPAQNGESAKLNLPPPVIETGGLEAFAKEADKGAEKLTPSSPELANGIKAPVLSNPPVQQIVIPDLPSFTPPANPAVDSNTTTIAAPVAADDSDLIEKEWVVKAKKIVDANRENPYNQSKEMTVFRADYMKKRYNKTINVSE